MAAQGWCPSTHRLHDAPDGPLARVRVPGSVLTADQLRAVAGAARDLGNGRIDLTRRANLQIRGVEDGGALRARLRPVGLSHPVREVEDRRNLIASPSADRALVAQALAVLDAFDRPGLPHKVGVLLDGGGTPSFRHVPADLAVGATGDVALGASLDEAVGSIELDRLGELVEWVLRTCARHGARMADIDERPQLAPPAVGQPPDVAGSWTELRPDTERLAALADEVDEVHLTPWRSVLVAA